MVEDSPEKEVHREKLKTTVVALDLHGGEITDNRRLRRLTQPSRATRPRHPSTGNRRGLASSGLNTE